MPVTDPIADFLTRIRNANQVKHEKVDMPASKLKEELAGVLKGEGYIRNYKRIENRKQGFLRIYLKYDEKNDGIISGLKRESKPGCRVYKKCEDLPRVLGGLGILVVSTSKGIMTGRQAKKERVGGEILCSVW